MDSKIEKKAFTLTMLGTLTEFTPELKLIAKLSPYAKGARVKEYTKGETLSIISVLIKTAKAAKTTKLDLKNPYSYQADEVSLVNGPKTDGSNVGEKIALGLAAVLKALVRGQTNINIIAHSRGAVESILITHELEAIKKVIADCANFDEVLKNLSEQQTKRHKGPPANNTPDIVVHLKTQINLIPQEEQELWFSLLKTSLPLATVNLFGIDPVPGDCFPITWYDERFFTLPEIIINAELIYYANERSDWGFTPIFPEVASKDKQHFVRYSMPGNHGTGSTGNDGSQQGIIVSADGTKTTHVQKLLIFKLLNFLNKQGVEFNDGTQIFLKFSALGKKYLSLGSEVTVINLAALDYPVIFRTIYAAIAKNLTAYEAYNFTNYSYMGLCKQRKALLKGHTYGVFNDIFTTYSGYVNEEHASLMQAHFFKIFGLDTRKKNLAEMINTAKLVLKENIKKIATKEPSILDSELTRQTVLETYGVVIRQVSQQYLTEDWSSKEKQKEKETLHQEIIDLFTLFRDFSDSDHIITQEFVIDLLLLGFLSINNTLKIQAQDLEKEFNGLKESTDNCLIHFFSGLLIRLDHSQAPAIILNEIISSDEYKLLPNHPSIIKISYIHKKLASKGLEKYSDEQLTKNYEEQFATTLADFNKLYQQIQILIENLGALRRLVPNNKIELNEVDLLRLTKDLIATAAERFYKDRPLSLPPIAKADTFEDLAEQHAVKHFGLIDRQKTLREANGYYSSTVSFFSKMIYGAPVMVVTKKEEELPKDKTTANSVPSL